LVLDSETAGYVHFETCSDLTATFDFRMRVNSFAAPDPVDPSGSVSVGFSS
jgi:hypothetical protein